MLLPLTSARKMLPPADPPYVLMTADSVGGVWTYALDLARELAGQGTRVTLAVLGPSPHPDQAAAAAAISAITSADSRSRVSAENTRQGDDTLIAKVVMKALS